VGIIWVVSGDGEQEMITEFFPQIQDSTENERTTCRQRVSLIPSGTRGKDRQKDGR